MRITVKHHLGQLIFLLIIMFALFNSSSCNANKEEKPVIPPETSPLSRNYIGFGVITASFTHINEDPVDDSASLGYLRRGSLVRIIRRQVIKTQGAYISWVLIDEKFDGPPNQLIENGINAAQSFAPGWLKEDIMVIYENESQARTASDSMQK
jgi:hypothetical protein